MPNDGRDKDILQRWKIIQSKKSKVKVEDKDNSYKKMKCFQCKRLHQSFKCLKHEKFVALVSTN